MVNEKKQNNMFLPLIWKVAKEYKAFKQTNLHVTKQPSTKQPSEGGSSTGASSSGSIQQGKKEGESVQGQSIFKLATWWK